MVTALCLLAVAWLCSTTGFVLAMIYIVEQSIRASEA